MDPVPVPPPAMSVAAKFLFLGVFALITVVLVLLTHLIGWFRAFRSERRRQRLEAQEADATDDAAEQAPEVNHGPSAHLPDGTVPDQLLKQASQRAQCVALVTAQPGAQRKQITYASLGGMVRRIAQQLRSLGVQQDNVVALALDRGVHQVTVVYAVMLSGSAWLPIDPAVPDNRLLDVLQDGSPSLLVFQDDDVGAHVAATAATAGIPAAAVLLDGSGLENGVPDVASEELPRLRIDRHALLIYTSGTTGKPKGIMYSHSMLSHGANVIGDLMEVGCGSVAFLKTPYIWAVVEWELFPALIRGGTLVVGSANGHKDPKYMADVILAEKVSCLVMAPDVLDLLLDIHETGSQLQHLRHVVTVGAGLPVSLANRFAKMRRLEAKLHNVYGASESSCTVWTVPPGGADPRLWSSRAPVGLPQAGCSVWVLDAERSPVPTGQTGEICFGGQLAMGYWKLPELTVQRFVNHPELGRIYCTGDLARWKAGVLEICGRKDRQLKIRGVRVEPEEIESALRGFQRSAETENAISEAPASSPLLDPEAPAGVPSEGRKLLQVGCVATTSASPELVAFVAPHLADGELQLVREHLAAALPPYYVPKHIFSRAVLPSLQNGKVDLRALTAEADRSVEASGGQVVMDSLGRMRNMSRAALLETQVIHRCYAYWMLGVMSDHWNACGMSGTAAFCAVENKPYVPPWVELFVRQVGNDQDMFGFIFLGALQDSRMPPGETKIRMRLGYADIFCFLVYLLMGFPIPQILYHILPGEMINEPCNSNWANLACSGHRWYLYMIVWTHLCIFVCQLVRMPGWLQALGHLALALWGPTEWPNPCAATRPDWFNWICIWVFPYAYRFDLSAYGMGVVVKCPIMYDWIQWYVVFYVLAFYYSRPGMKVLTDLVSRLGCNSAAWAWTAFGVTAIAGAAQAAFHYPNVITESGVGGPDFNWWDVPLEFGINMCQPLLLALAMAWFPFDLTWWGNTTLGTYLVHFYFFVYMNKKLPELLEWMEPVQGLPQLLVLLAIPIAFMTVVGPFFHYMLLSPSFAVRRIRAMCSRRALSQQARARC